MKKLYISLGLIAMGTAAMAQQLTPLHKSPAKRTFSRAEVSPTTIIARQEKPMSDITGNRVVVLDEDFQTSGAIPTALPAGWLTNIVSQTEGTSATTDDTEGPAFKVHNSTSANDGGYWPVPELGVNNRFAGANDDNVPCDCDFIDVWVQSPAMDLNDYNYTEVWGIINYTPVVEPWTDSQILGDGPEHIATVVGDPNVSWNSVTINFTAPDTSLPVSVNINGMDYTLDMSGTIDVSMSAFSGDLEIYIASNNGGQLTGVEVNAEGDFLTGDFITDTTFTNPGDAGAEVISLDSTFVGNYTLSFDFFHDANFGGGDATVQISTDNGVSWQILDTLTIDGSYWQSIVMPLYAYNGATASIRFQWTDGGSWASGFAVDNVIVQSALNNDMIMAKTIASDWNNATFGLGFWEYSQVPVTQVSPVRATSVVYNGGFNDQPGVSVNYEVSFNGAAQATFSSDVLDVISLDKDTLSGVSTWTPSAVGTVAIASSVVSPNGDDNMGNNMGSAQIEITNDVYARDLGAAQAFVGPGTAYEYGNLFDIYANDDFGAIDVAVNFATVDEGSLIQGKLYEFTGLDATTGEPMLTDLGVSTIEYAVTAADNNAAGDANFIHLSFTEPIALEAGKVYLASIISDGAIRTPVSGNNDWVVSWLNDGTWGATGGIPMIRLNSDESLVVDINVAENMNNGLSLSQNVPNPAVDMTTVNYSIANNESVNVIVRDITGRVVMNINEGVKSAGNHSIRLNVEELGAGIYTYTVVAGQSVMTKEMMVK